MKSKLETEVKKSETMSSNNGRRENRLHSPMKDSSHHSLLSSDKCISTSNSERETPAEVVAAEAIKDLIALKEIGGNSLPRRVDYQDSNRYVDAMVKLLKKFGCNFVLFA